MGSVLVTGKKVTAERPIHNREGGNPEFGDIHGLQTSSSLHSENESAESLDFVVALRYRDKKLKHYDND